MTNDPRSTPATTATTPAASSSASSSISPGPPKPPNPLEGTSRWALTEHGRRARLSEWLGLIDDDNLTLVLRRHHWPALADPWLDAATRYVTVQDAGRHRLDDALAAGVLPYRVYFDRTPLTYRGRHACRCPECAFTTIAAAYAELDRASSAYFG